MGKLKKAAKKIGRKVDKTIDKTARAFDPRTSDGLKNIATGGAYGVTKELGGAAKNALGGDTEGPKETEAEKEAARVASKEFEFARQMDFVKDEYAKRVEKLGSKPMQDSIIGKANLNSQNLSKNLNDRANQELQSSGIDPSSGRGTSTVNRASTVSASAAGESRGESAFALDNSHLQGKQNRIAMAMGDKTDAVQGLQEIAGRSNQEAIDDAVNSFNSGKATAEAIGTGAGLAFSHYNKPSQKN